MSSTFFGLEMMKRALFAQQTALNTVGHNIANANTPGYSRQTVNMTASQPMYYPSMSSGGLVGQIGTGVDVQSITRMREAFLDAQYRNQNQMLGEWEVKSDTVKKLEAIFNEPSDTGLTATLNQFFNAWQTLSTDPNNPSARSVVLQRGKQLADLLNETAQELNDLNNDLQTNIQTQVTQVNSYIDQIQKLNVQIKSAETFGANANDLRDQRDYLVDQLSKIADIKVTENNQSYTLQVGDKTVLVDDGSTTWKHVVYDSGTFYTVNHTITNPQSTDYDTPSLNIQSGELKGLVDSQNFYVDAYINQLNDFTNTLVTQINTQHENGYTLSFSQSTNVDFFTANSNNAAASIKVAITDTSLIAAASKNSIYTNDSGTLSGDGNNALSIGNMYNQSVTFPNSSVGTFEDFLRSMVGQLGVQGQEADQMEKNQNSLVNQMDTMRQSVSGVSLDEEMANMIKYQQAYGAAARLVTTIDSLLNTIVTGMGVTR
jgi:flagellar hook-associated protein 1 FlgK